MNKEQGYKYRAQSWLGIWGLADLTIIYIWSSGTFTGTGRFRFWFADVAPRAGATPSWA